MIIPLHRLVCGIVIAGLAAPAVLSAYGQHFPSDYDLNSRDLEIIRQSAAPLFSTDAVGQSQAWTNPQSGKRGSITLMGVYQLRGLPCRRMEYATFTPLHPGPDRLTFDWCQIATGEWEIVDPSELGGG